MTSLRLLCFPEPVKWEFVWVHIGPVSTKFSHMLQKLEEDINMCGNEHK